MEGRTGGMEGKLVMVRQELGGAGGSGHVLTRDSINQNVVQAEYAVRGKLYAAAQARSKAGKQVILTNVGNPQALGQKPITFPRQVLALVTHPPLMERAKSLGIPSDAVQRAQEYLAAVGSTGAYQDSRGNALVRKQVADFITRRDGFPADPDSVFLTDGAGVGITLCMRTAIRGRHDGVMMPIPQYPLYSATVEVMNGTKVGYFLDESNEWGMDIAELDRAYNDAVASGVTPRIIVVINPGNPTGMCLTMENLKDVLMWCARRRVVLFADEVYQTNIYKPDTRPFISFKKALGELGGSAQCSTELVSFNTVSKGALGECGRRGAYFEVVNVDSKVVDEIYKLLSMNLSSNVDGQIYVGLMCQPPVPGDPSFPLYNMEMNSIIESLKRRALRLARTFNTMEGVQCTEVTSSMYAFPQITLPPAAIEAARQAGHKPDEFYCLELLDQTGICVVPGSGFGQKDSTFHFRTTILPPESMFDDIIERFTSFHAKFMRQYGGAKAKL
ncbi:Glutamate--glyoxylate aminotransferase 1 [Porphyridium purpureum]|uniref:Glutamate--glyoxylate aminotransferase 1 n=1 Tax=Porphyridium purpureum TaxID=35688 RepID=A0A5J4Z541_PORPP|nr:Glutamate--glyoxylate aminotransferase 1 [Porphyridium purpureum]|eukprot:POR6863..scf295_1